MNGFQRHNLARVISRCRPHCRSTGLKFLHYFNQFQLVLLGMVTLIALFCEHYSFCSFLLKIVILIEFFPVQFSISRMKLLPQKGKFTVVTYNMANE